MKNKKNCLSCSNSGSRIRGDYEIYFCKDCQHYFYIKKSERKVLFGHENVGSSQSETRSRQFQNIFNFITRNTNASEIIEIGSGFGGYINFANKLGYNCTAVDIDSFFQDNYKERGIDFIQMDIENFDMKVSQNVVIMSHILEHLTSPLNSLKKIINSNVEFIVIEVPNFKGAIFKLSKLLIYFKIDFIWNRLWQKNSNSPHLYYFSDASFNNFASKMDLKIEKTFNARFSTFKGSFKRTRATENLLVSLISVVIIQFLEVINIMFNTPENKVYIMRNLNYK